MSERRAVHLSDADLHRLRAALVKKRDELIAAQRATTAEQRGIHDRESEQGDVAENLIEQEASLRLGAFDATLLADVERALQKLEDGNFGNSEESGVPIPLERLEAVPWARRTAQEEQRKQHGS
jgi:DnaK suppressor protein